MNHDAKELEEIIAVSYLLGKTAIFFRRVFGESIPADAEKQRSLFHVF